MASMAVPTRLPRAPSLSIMEGITNMARLNRLTRLTGMTRLPILGELVKNGKTRMAQTKMVRCQNRQGRKLKRMVNGKTNHR